MISLHLRTIYALIIRDLMVRFGRGHLGFAWTVLEPLILTSGVMALWTFMKEPTIHGVPVAAFVMTGYMPLTLWRHLSNPMTRILSSNSNLLYHRMVSSFDIILARSCLEFLSTSAALTIMYFVVVTTGIVEPAQDLGLTLAGWIMTAWYFGATGLMLSACSEAWEPVEKFLQPLQYLSLPLSGVFFMVDWLPNYARKLLLLNPSVHCFEMFRAGFLGESVTTHFDCWYLAAWSLAMSVVGAASVYQVRNRLRFN